VTYLVSPPLANRSVLHAGANYHIPYTHILLQNEIPLNSTLSYLNKAGEQRLTTIFNPSPMLSPGQLRDFPWSDLTWLIVNEGELEDLLHAFGSSGSGGDIRESAEAGLKVLNGLKGFERVSVICTLGAKGILYFQPEEKKIGHLPAASLKRELKDTTGAGDCFAGYFAAGLMKGSEHGIEEILRICLSVSMVDPAGTKLME
jgi:ribokinase